MPIFHATIQGSVDEEIFCRIYSPTRKLWLGAGNIWGVDTRAALYKMSSVGSDRLAVDITYTESNIVVEYLKDGMVIAEDLITTPVFEATAPEDSNLNLSLIEEFKEATGRLDLSNAEIFKFLNRGSRILDRRSLRQKVESRSHSVMQPGIYTMTTHPDLRAIQSVWAVTANRRWELQLQDFATMRAMFNTQPPEVRQGDPKFYCPTSVTLGQDGSVDGETPDSEFFPQWSGDVVVGNPAGYRGLIVWPIPAEPTVIEIIGKFYTPILKDADGYRDNWWSLNHPQLLLMAALISMDRNYRNTAGATTLYSEIDAELQNIFFDDIEEEANLPSAMEGSEYGLYSRY